MNAATGNEAWGDCRNDGIKATKCRFEKAGFFAQDTVRCPCGAGRHTALSGDETR
ncbi:MAG: hypothetical protein NC305_14885 [Lachnospiraceae bacterium]|nr:hypothetical protein [Acetatifactor muris]MCM1218584.1 hypothetical protein [Lachnospiraceae bacterium]MCM1411814.1 hypothetical protein [Lachnospiraceae bacterium]